MMKIFHTLRFKIISLLSVIIILVSICEIYYLNHRAFYVVSDIVLDTKMKNASQVLSSIDRYFESSEAISKKPINAVNISSLLKKDSSGLSSTEKSSNMYTIQMFLFREVMLENTDIESCLLYDASDKEYYAISDTYVIYKNSYYNFSIHDQDYKQLTPESKYTFISGIRPSGMQVQPHEDFVVTYAVAYPNYFQNNQILYGAFYINIKASAFADLCSKNYAESDGSCFLLDQDNKIIYCDMPDYIGKPIDRFYPVDSILKEASPASITDESNVYTLTRPSSKSGWRVLTIAQTSLIFSYKKIISQTVIISMLILITTLFLTMWIVISRFTRPITLMKQKLLSVTAGDLSVRFEGAKDEIGQVNTMLQNMLDHINELIQLIYKEENEKRELELHALQNQITPHFIYNTLSRLKWMATIQQADSLAEALGSFSDILAYCKNSTEYFVLLKDEVAFIDNYIRIMNLRMINEVRVCYDIPEELHQCRMLRFLLQPIVENVFLHAFNGIEHECILSLSVSQEGPDLIFTIEDNGVGIPAGRLEHILQPGQMPDAYDDHISIALKNVEKRIKSNYGEAYGLSIKSEYQHGTAVTVLLPFHPSIYR